MGKNKKILNEKIFFVIGFILLFGMSFIIAATPDGPDSLDLYRNETKGSTSAGLINISGGRIAAFNLTSAVQNTRWKGFVGNVFGSFTLDDSTGATIYDWSLSTLTGRLYSTRNISSPLWSSVVCANSTTLEDENVLMNHSNVDDNITATFDNSSHTSFTVGSVSFAPNECNNTVNTYNSTGASNNSFEEVALYDTSGIVYASILEENAVGFDGATYDFQMIVPENGASSFIGSTAYYFYLELGN